MQRPYRSRRHNGPRLVPPARPKPAPRGFRPSREDDDEENDDDGDDEDREDDELMGLARVGAAPRPAVR